MQVAPHSFYSNLLVTDTQCPAAWPAGFQIASCTSLYQHKCQPGCTGAPDQCLQGGQRQRQLLWQHLQTWYQVVQHHVLIPWTQGGQQATASIWITCVIFIRKGFAGSPGCVVRWHHTEANAVDRSVIDGQQPTKACFCICIVGANGPIDRCSQGQEEIVCVLLLDLPDLFE